MCCTGSHNSNPWILFMYCNNYLMNSEDSSPSGMAGLDLSHNDSVPDGATIKSARTDSTMLYSIIYLAGPLFWPNWQWKWCYLELELKCPHFKCVILHRILNVGCNFIKNIWLSRFWFKCMYFGVCHRHVVIIQLDFFLSSHLKYINAFQCLAFYRK